MQPLKLTCSKSLISTMTVNAHYYYIKLYTGLLKAFNAITDGQLFIKSILALSFHLIRILSCYPRMYA
jgi:hypothetical protein